MRQLISMSSQIKGIQSAHKFTSGMGILKLKNNFVTMLVFFKDFSSIGKKKNSLSHQSSISHKTQLFSDTVNPLKDSPSNETQILIRPAIK